ncbi:MAG TPA: FmdB family zinc ribbon protein [Ktedonobacteraceae bacterium]
MPTYEYLCQACSHRFEQWQKMTDESLVTCPECGGHIRRVFFPAGIVFKGSGFYKTDHRASSSTKDANGQATKGEEVAATAGSDSKGASESKSAATESSSSGSSSSASENKAPAATTAATK